MKKLLYILFTVMIMAGLYSCAESDDFSSSGNLKLAFSSDTVSFDTVFTTVGTATRTIQIYNKNDKSLTIESIEIMNPQKSGFQMNIDGESGTRLTNVSILKKDSLYGFFRVTVDPLNVNSPVLIRDSIRFVTNGNVQYIYLEAIGRDVYKWTGKLISADTVLTDEKPFLVYDTIQISKDATLTMKEGTEVYFHNKSSLQVYGTLKAEGTVENPVVFRGDRLDNMTGSVPYDNIPGQWDGLVFHPESYNNRLENIVIKNAVNGIKFLSSDTQSKKATLINTIVHNSSEKGIEAVNCDIDAMNCLFTNAGNALLDLSGGKYSFLHTTIANYYVWTIRRSESVILRNTNESTNLPATFEKCDFINSIIYGSESSEIGLPADEEGLVNYKFTNCLVRSQKEFDDARFVNVIWNRNAQFTDINKSGFYYYDFSLQNSSPAIDKADRTYSFSIPLDIRGNSRLNDADPDMGCYEWTAE